MIEIIIEGRDAPLYHCTDLTSAINILATNELRPGIASTASWGEQDAICFTRDSRYTVHPDSIIQFVFNQAKLVNKYKVRPVSEPGFDQDQSESEERIITSKPIPVSKYLLYVDIVPGYERTFTMWVNKTIRKPNSTIGKEIATLVDWWYNEKVRFGPRITKIFTEHEDELI